MAAGLRSLIARWLGGAGANPDGEAPPSTTDALCFGAVRVVPTLRCTPKFTLAMDAEISARPALRTTVTVGCDC